MKISIDPINVKYCCARMFDAVSKNAIILPPLGNVGDIKRYGCIKPSLRLGEDHAEPINVCPFCGTEIIVPKKHE